MKISEIFNLEKSQPELDFIDVDINHDTPLFIDPFFLGTRQDKWSIEATRTIRSFFQQVIQLIRDNDLRNAKLLFRHLHEPNSTCLGMSRGTPRGRGVGNRDTDDIFENLVKSRAIQTGLIEDIEDNILFVEGFGKDKLSDMTTNITRWHLIKYTIDQCNLHNIKLQPNIPSGFYWSRQQNRWEQKPSNALIIDERKILLVPKGIVSFCKDYVPTKYYQHYVLNFMQNEHLEINSALIQRKKDGTPYVTKKDLKEKHPYSKRFLTEFTQRNPEVLNQFKREASSSSLTNSELDDVNIKSLITHLTHQLESTPTGAESASVYHRLIKSIMEILFYPFLIYPDLEKEIHEGRKRIDITFDNAATSGIFYRFSNNMQLPCQYIFMECKNYTADPANPELDQLSGRFSPNRGRVGFLICRRINDMERFINRCRDTYRDNRGLIIPLVDNDINNLLSNYNDRDFNFLDEFLSERVRQITIN